MRIMGTPARPLACLALAALACAAAPAWAQPPSRNAQVLANRNDYPPAPGSPLDAGYSACWSYIHGDGREYAVIGTLYGTAIYNVTNPAAPVFAGFIQGPYSSWREMKSYRNWIYVVTESNDV